MIHEVLAVGPLRCNCSILGDEISLEAIVIDPGEDISRIVAALGRHRLTVKQIVITHAHIDHIAGAQRLRVITGAPIVYNEADLPQVKMMAVQASWLGVETPEVPMPDVSPGDDSVVSVSGISGRILYTPGHTQGSLCLHLAEHQLLIAGDTLFAGSIGRTDLPGGNTQQLLRSISDRLLVLPDVTRVLPGHGPATTIGDERQTNPFLQDL